MLIQSEQKSEKCSLPQKCACVRARVCIYMWVCVRAHVCMCVRVERCSVLIMAKCTEPSSASISIFTFGLAILNRDCVKSYTFLLGIFSLLHTDAHFMHTNTRLQDKNRAENV